MVQVRINKLINEVEVSNDNIWQKKLLKTIEENYKKAPFFKEVFPVIDKIIENDEKNLAKYLEFFIKEICKYLDIKTELVLSSNLKKDNSLKGKDKVIAICEELKGTEYYSFEEFKQNGIELRFLKTNEIIYKQFNDEFILNLSILDILMFNSKEKVKEILSNYSLIEE